MARKTKDKSTPAPTPTPTSSSAATKSKSAAKKAAPPPPKPKPEDDFIVFSNSDKDPKPRRKPAAEAEAGPSNPPTDPNEEPGPPKLTIKQIIGGISWTGKLPVNLLQEHCQKMKWDRPDFMTHHTAEGSAGQRDAEGDDYV